jgi:hypothetical protein
MTLQRIKTQVNRAIPGYIGANDAHTKTLTSIFNHNSFAVEWQALWGLSNSWRHYRNYIRSDATIVTIKGSSKNPHEPHTPIGIDWTHVKAIKDRLEKMPRFIHQLILGHRNLQ